MVPALFFFFASLVNDVRGLIAQHDFAGAERAVRAYRAQTGATSELAAALSWLARGALDAKRFDQAESYAAETRTLALELLGTRQLDGDRWLPTALGASIEVHAQALAARGERPEAISFLREQLALFGATSLDERIRKNMNLLTLEGKPVPPLEANDWLGPKPASLAALRGHPVLLFFWAHWCPDCKAEAPVLAALKNTYGPQGLVLLGPTRLYGYVAGGEEAAPAAEKQYIEQVRRRYYAALADMPAPLSAANFVTYGASTTPTLILIDRAGVVRFYHPGAVSEAELSARIQAILRE
jgi:thiol-disulfide isomerase/thioredoxin